MRFFFALISISVLFLKGTATVPDLTYEEALKQAAVLADSWSAQEQLIYELGERIKPETIPEVKFSEEATGSVNNSTAEPVGELEKQFLEEVFDELGQPTKPLDETIYLVQFNASESYIDDSTPIYTFDSKTLSCKGEGSNETLTGYCKSSSLCTSFGGEAIGLCWRNNDVTAVCCQPSPDSFFPIPRVDESEVNIIRLRRAAGVAALMPAGDLATYSKYVTSSIQDTTKYLSECSYKMKSIKYPTDSAVYRLSQRQSGTGDINAAGNAMLNLLLAAKYILKKYPTWTVQQALAVVTESDLGKKSLERYCIPEPICDMYAKWRTFDGSCNNIKDPLAGKAGTPMIRLLPANYQDGILSLRGDYQKQTLPNGRYISSKFPGEEIQEKFWSTTVMDFGQFVNHDLALSPNLAPYNDEKDIIKCCKADGYGMLPAPLHPACIPISVPANDKIYAPNKINCLNLVRSAMGFDTDCYLTPAQQVSGVSTWLDGSQIYGTTEERANSLRAFYGGLLRFSTYENDPYLPVSNGESCYAKKACTFVAGDDRNIQTSGLNHMHLLWLRHHNYIAKVLYEINPWWDDNRLYQEARRIIIAQYQYIVYEEYLGILFGADTLKKAGLELGKRGFTYNYNPKLKAGTVNEFASFGFRYGHSQVLDEYWLMSALYPDLSQAEGKKKAEEIALSDTFFQCPGVMCLGRNAYKRFWYGVANHEVYKVDTHIEASMHHELFKKKGAKVGLDIIATDIYRGRDHGMQPYYKYVEYCQHVYINSWNDLIKYGLMTAESVKILSYLYKNVKDVDAFVGASYEITPKGYFLGRTFACITLQTFKRLRDTDRYFYSEKDSNPGAFTKEQLYAIQDKTSLSGIICEASINSLEYYVPKAMFTPAAKKFNPITPCSKIKKLEKADLLAWYEPPPPKISAGVCQMVDSYGKATFGTCLIPSHCESSYSKDYPAGKYKSYACPKGLQCCKGNPGVLRAHIKYSEPTIDQYKQFYKLEATALSQAITTVQNSDESLYVSVQNCGDSYVDGYGQIRYLLSSHLYTDDQQTKIALDSITAQYTFKYIINALNTPQYGKGYGKKDASYQKTAYAVAASTFYGILWKDLEAKLYVCFKPHPCDCYHPYRTASGDCTSKKAPDLGVTSLSQYLATSLTSYKDGINQYPVAVYGSLPNPRVLSVQLVTKKSNYLSKTFSLITPYFMKLVSNDIFQAAFFTGVSLLDCCDNTGKSIETYNPSCAAINLGNYYDKDPVFGRLKVSCIPVLKKVPGLVPGCSVQRNSAMNVATSLLDASVIYGNSQADEKRFRTYSRGLIQMQTKPGDKLPVLSDDPALFKKYGKVCDTLRPCKLLAWSRGNGHPEMLPFVALFYREHNRLAKILAEKYPYWTDNEIYHEAKAINIGQFETVVIQELVEALLGDDLVKYYKLRLEDLEYLVEYQNPLDVIGPSDQAGALAWRMVWHNMIRPTQPVPLYPAQYGKKQDPNLFDTWFYLYADDRKCDSRIMDLYLTTVLSQYAENVDTYVFAESEGAYRFKESSYGSAGAYGAYKDSYSEEVTVAWDNIAQLIQDSRVDGVGSYNDYREACGYPRAKTIDDMYDLIYDKGRISKLKYAYKSADDVDLIMGLWYETPKSKNTPLGGVTICLIAHMVKDWMLQDNRFFNHPKNPRKFTKDQIKAISYRTLASIMCDNTEYIDAYRPGYFAEFTKNVFLWQSSYNPLKSCKDLPKLTLAEWNYKTSILTAYDTNYAYKADEYKPPTYELYGQYASSYKASPPEKYPSSSPPPQYQGPSSKYPPPPKDTYPAAPKPGYPAAPKPNYPAAPKPGYPAAPKPSYPAAPKPSYPAAPKPGYPAAPKPSYPAAPKPGYPAAPKPGYPAAPKPGYPASPKPGYPASPTPSYPAPPKASYPPAPKKKTYPEAKPAKAYPSYNAKHSGSYEKMHTTQETY